VDASRSRLYLFENTPQGLRLVADYYASVGKLGIEKSVEGDQRTPLGVYFITSRLDPATLRDFYGAGALPLNYPNPLDQLRGKTGSGIWLHGTPPDQFSARATGHRRLRGPWPTPTWNACCAPWRSPPASAAAPPSAPRPWSSRTLATLAVGLAAGPFAQDTPKVKFATTAGDFVVELYPDKAPKTVENFLQYVKDKHYDGTIFHRVIDNFMVQGGGFDASYVEKAHPRAGGARRARSPGQGWPAQCGRHAGHGPHAGSELRVSAQFFINVKDNAFLDPTLIPPGIRSRVSNTRAACTKMCPGQSGQQPAAVGYTVFGKVISGMDVITR
jgi:cyclophilin family peptidyl-prolyl cis-trans isomerase